MDKAKISVIMPVLNGMPYLKTALTSVLDQSVKDIEVIVVDAGSRDGSVQYVEEQKKHDSRIKLLYSECKSMGYQYNLGIQNADGEYVGFCESDDYLASDMLEKLYRTAEERGEMDFIKSDFFMFIGTAGNEFSIKYEVLSSKYRHLYGKKINIEVMPELLFRDVNMWNGIYRKDFIEKKGIRLNETQGASFQDIGFIEQVLLSGADGLYITDAYYHYRRDNEGSSVYKDTAVYVLQELSYILRFVEERKDIKEKYGDLILDRLFDFFCDRYGRKLYYDLPGTFDEFIKEIQKVLKKYTEKCRNEGIDMPSSVHFHMVRKTHAMSLYQEGCPLSYIQQMLGHENISTTSGFYAFVTLDTLSKAIEKANPSGENAEKNWKRKDIAKSLYRL